ncbi:PleD family two-component system response regulator [Bowmanella sp. JS7-9]|uniref:PleD family two-component system response regulator n=1 Tax=Pseudobowmanella zhangzhouensis TaxID=1537679 RepID=A0ABW1XN34_9ALTE|nr:response regulator [Bowmanella sp. JS7-9]
MDDSRPRILIVDDSTIDIQIILNCLQDEYQVTVAKSGEQAMNLLAQMPAPPQVILLDVMMPGMSGYETCQQIKQQQDTADVDVIFISANQGADEMLRGYESGGSDYLCKPVIIEEVQQKVRLAVERNKHRVAQSQQAKDYLRTAMTAIHDLGDQGVIIHFLRESFACPSIQDLCRLMHDAIASMQLNASVQIRTPWETYHYMGDESPPPLEVELLKKLRDSGRINQVGRRLIMNHDAVSLLIKNMPVDDEDRCGRIRDHLALLLDGAVSRFETLLVHTEILSILQDIQDSMTTMHYQQNKNKQRSIEIMDALTQDIHKIVVNEHMTEQQEQTLLDTIERHSDEIFQAYEEGLQMDEQFSHIVNHLQRAIRPKGGQ